ncbi:MAG: Omp28-related outer membrane protein [Candidatus Kapabacteria bacterium]|nr:Omp28-related outer membrane protein [Ignavibacteriota bacterium]MCW5885816.1 Omp28-related outer membrane protein [Candidatus Kapabacteria bacterium]
MRTTTKSPPRRLILNLLIFSSIIIAFSSTELIAQYKRNIVFEIFSEVWCGPCASLTPMHKAWLKNHPDYIPVYYYSYFMVNNQKVINAQEDYNYRKNLYSVPFFPYARINAVNAPNEAYPGFPTDTNRINAIIDTMSKTTPVNVDINFVNNGHSGSVKIDITSNIELNNKVLFVYLIEKEHIYSSQQNGMTDFNYIMRKSLPKSSGEIFSIKAGEKLTYDYNYTLDTKINTDLYATVIVQDISTKYIYQSGSVFKSFATSVNNESSYSELQIYPNPAYDFITIFPINNGLNPYDKSTKVQIFDVLGIEVMSTEALLEMSSYRVEISRLPVGVYFIRLGDRFQKFMKTN